MFADLMASFVVQTSSGVVAVFVGVVLALVVERRRREQDTQLHDAELMREFERATDTILGSVVKNTAEAKGILRMLANRKGPCLIHAGLESSVWYATQDQFIALCRSVDQRVMFALFFDNVRRLQSFMDFRCNLQVSTTTAKLDPDEPGLHSLLADVDNHMAELAEELRFCGVLLITDHGKPVHKRLMGIRTATDTATACKPG